jgi:hypothetical protein
LDKSQSLIKEFDNIYEKNHDLKQVYKHALKTGEDLLTILIQIDAIESQLEWIKFRNKRKLVIIDIQALLDRIDSIKDDLKMKI